MSKLYEIEGRENLSDYEDPNDVMPDNVKALEDQVVGHKIVSVERNVKFPMKGWHWSTHGTKITLDNGKSVYLVDTNDCCAYTEVEAFMLNPQSVDHMITGVGTENGFRTWHVFADMTDVLALTVGWSGSNGYYGYGFEFKVFEPGVEDALWLELNQS